MRIGPVKEKPLLCDLLLRCIERSIVECRKDDRRTTRWRGAQNGGGRRDKLKHAKRVPWAANVSSEQRRQPGAAEPWRPVIYAPQGDNRLRYIRCSRM